MVARADASTNRGMTFVAYECEEGWQVGFAAAHVGDRVLTSNLFGRWLGSLKLIVYQTANGVHQELVVKVCLQLWFRHPKTESLYLCCSMLPHDLFSEQQTQSVWEALFHAGGAQSL